MAHSKHFKDILVKKIEARLKREYGVKMIQPEFESSVLSYSAIFWDFYIVLRQHNLSIIIEIETGRQDPSTNLLKTLIWLEENPASSTIIFVHLFDPMYDGYETPARDYCRKLWDYIKKENKEHLRYGPFHVDKLKEVAKANKKIKNSDKVCKRIVDILERVIKRTIRDIK